MKKAKIKDFNFQDIKMHVRMREVASRGTYRTKYSSQRTRADVSSKSTGKHKNKKKTLHDFASKSKFKVCTMGSIIGL